MTQIASEDYDNLRIYLHVDTVTQGFDPALMQQEHRALRRLNSNDERGYDIMVTFSGNESKGGGKFTPGLTILRSGVRIIPYDTDHSLDIVNEIVNIDDAVSDRDVFDRSGITSNIDIDPTYSPVEVRVVTTGSGVTSQDKTDIKNLIFAEVLENSETFAEAMRLIRAESVGSIERSGDTHTIKSADGLTDRIVADATQNGRTVTSTDGS